MNTIHKYLIPTVDRPTVEMPVGARIVRFSPQGPMLYLHLWAIVDTDQPFETREFALVGTGHPVPSDCDYVASCEEGPFVWHLFQPVKPGPSYVNLAGA